MSQRYPAPRVFGEKSLEVADFIRVEFFGSAKESVRYLGKGVSFSGTGGRAIICRANIGDVIFLVCIYIVEKTFGVTTAYLRRRWRRGFPRCGRSSRGARASSGRSANRLRF